ncbi:uncharacterized protein [Channa argus]|uniref:uncharacterized protein n=1 Tax=Channa argus TaxID=215402 RepID=UPI0035230C07
MSPRGRARLAFRLRLGLPRRTASPSRPPRVPFTEGPPWAARSLTPRAAAERAERWLAANIADEHCPLSHPLSERYHQWTQLCVLDKWMDRIIRKGYSLQFATPPPSFAGILETRLSSPAHATALASELSDLLGKQAISVVPPMEENQGFYSRYFLVPKKSGEMRPILDLSFLNQFMVVRRFHMLTTASVLRSVRPGDWLSSVDLKDAYFHIPVAMQHRKFLRFSFLGVRYQYNCLPFGYSLAPRTFSKCLETALAPLRAAGMRVLFYLDDLLLLAPSREQALLQMVDLVTHLSSLGFTINWRKSSPFPAQSIIFLGVELDVPIMRARLSQERRETLLAMLHRLTPRRVVTVHSVMRLLGMMAAALSVVPLGLLHMRRLQRWFSRLQLDPVRHRRRLVMIPPSVGPDLAYWRGPRVMLDGVPLGRPSSHVSVFTDASLLGWGGTCLSQSVGAPWPEGMSLHINALELLSVWNVLQHFAPVLLDCHVLVHTDNTTTASYINRQGGVRSSRLLSIARRLLLWAHSHLRSIRAVYIPGVLNTAADTMSRGGGAPPRGMGAAHRATPRGLEQVWQSRGGPFCSQGQCPVPPLVLPPSSRFPPPWGGCILPLPLAQAAPLCISACPSDSPVTRPCERGVSHRHPCGPKASGGTVVPVTLSNAGRPALGAPVAFGRIVSGQRDDPQSPSSAPAPVGLAPERKRLADQGFSPRVVATIQGARAASTTSSYVAKWSSFQRWCSERGVSASSCPLPRVLSFLQTLVDRGLSLSTVKTYAAAISSCHEGFGDRSVFSHPLLKRFLRGVRRQRPLLRPLAPPWDLSLVLRALVVSPFEPLEQVPLRLLSWKTALLLALTSMKRVSDLSALSVSPECLSIRGDLSLAVLRPNPAFMPKCITSSFRSRVITLEGFCTPPHTSEEDASSHLLCPVRALSYYVERTSTIRRSERLFVHYREGSAGLPLSAQRLSHWLCEAIFQAYESSGAQPPEGIRAHSTRGIASSVALLRGVSVEDICLAASWSSTCSFVRFYLRDVSRPSLSSSVLSAPQSAHSGVG